MWYSSLLVSLLTEEQKIICVNRQFFIKTDRNHMWDPLGLLGLLLLKICMLLLAYYNNQGLNYTKATKQRISTQ